MRCEKDLATKRKLSYYKKDINSTLEDQKYLSILSSSKKKINIAKIRTNSHELHSETGHQAVPKTPWMERICHLCENRIIEDENHFLLECPAYNQIRSQFQNLCCNTNLRSLLRCQNITSSQSAPCTTTLDLSFKIFVTILTFLVFYIVKITLSSGGFSRKFLSIGIKY